MVVAVHRTGIDECVEGGERSRATNPVLEL